MRKDVMLVTGAGQIGMAIARRVGFGKKIILGDKNIDNARTIAKIMNDAGYDVEPFEMDLSSRNSILAIIAKAQEYGEIRYLVNAAGVSPSQAPIEAILRVDLYGTAVLLEEVGKVIAEGGAGVTIRQPVRLADAGAKCGAGQTACHDANGRASFPSNPSAGKHQRYASRLSAGKTLQ